ncbi:MAG: PAS domain S-box protein [Desulfobulbaceae bacterium]|nr:PAS domain S-box protein [Desulfobulbaceae bacterium]HIJ91038.1 PAS domain S-box protein [Deltaproteobacteria bacterium]
MTDQSHSVPWYRSLRFKLVATAITVELIMLSALLFNSFRLLDQAVESQTQARLEAFLPLLDAALAGRVFQRDHTEVKAILNRLTSTRRTDIRYITVLDPDGNVIASSGNLDHEVLPKEDHSVAEAMTDLTYDARLPLTIIGNEVGSVHFGLSLNSMVTTQNQVVQEGIFIAAFEILLSLLLLASGGYLITRHIRSLTEGTRRVAQGDYSAQILIPGNDEITVLANDFNAMSAAVATHVNELRASEMRSLAIFNAVSEAIFIHDAATGEILDVNQRMCEMYGCTREEALRCDLAVFSADIPPYTLDVALTRIQTAVAGTPQTFDWLARARDGRLFWAEISLRRARIGDDDRLIAVVRDISDRKKNEEHITRLATAIEQAAEDIIITDLDGVIQYVNPAQKNTTGYADDELLGSSLSLFKNEKGDEVFDRNIWNILKDGRKWEGRLVNRAKDGRVLLQDSILAPIRDAAGTVSGYVCTRRDVTRQVETETHLAQTQKLEAIGTLAGGIAHDFNNILSAIVGYTELALAENLPREQRMEYLRRVLQASGRAADLVRQILAFSRMETQGVRSIKVKPIVKEALKLIRATIPSTIEIRGNIASESLTLADPGEIHRIIINLCTNAALAMHDTGGVLAVDLEDVEIDAAFISNHPWLVSGQFLCLTVSDTGCGMNPEIASRIFEPFFTTRSQGQGTGMGLSVVDGIVKSRGGAIVVTSESGAGATFKVFLPVTVAEDIPKPTEAEGFMGGTERILFVDDELMLMELAKMMLDGLGYRVDAYSSSIEALASFEKSPDDYDLVVTDMNMPQMSGDVLAERIKAVRPSLPILLCTGYSDKNTAGLIDAGIIEEVAMKPIVGTQLARAIRRVLDR